MNYFEVVFDILYLVSVVIISLIIIKRGFNNKSKAVIIFGFMGLLLGFGDSFHLIPRIIAHLTTGMDDYQSALGIGKLITGITMTFFYYLIYHYYVLITGKNNKKIHLSILVMMIIRFVLLALPGNDWINNGNSLLYGIIRNIPFAIIGGIIVTLFIQVGQSPQYKVFRLMGYWIIVSFVCYLIVILASGFVPILGALMMPKTVAYFIIIYLGFKNS